MSVTVTYPCPQPMCDPAQVAKDAFANITLPQHLLLAPGNSSVIALGDVSPGGLVSAAWWVVVDDSYEKTGQVDPISITAQG